MKYDNKLIDVKKVKRIHFSVTTRHLAELNFTRVSMAQTGLGPWKIILAKGSDGLCIK